MQLAYQVPILDIIASNAPFTSDWFRVPVGSTIRLNYRLSAIVGAPLTTAAVQAMNHNADPVTLITLPLAAVGSASASSESSPEFIRTIFTQAGGANTSTATIDLIIQPPDSTPA